MHKKCPKINWNCGFCGESEWNPLAGKYDGRKRLFCGLAPASWDVQVDSLPNCPQDMTKSQLKGWQAKKKKEKPMRYYT